MKHQLPLLPIKLLVIFLLITLLHSTTLCQSNGIDIKISGNSLELVYKGRARLSGGAPEIQNVQLGNSLRSLGNDSFTYGNVDKTVTVHFKKSKISNVVGAYLSSTGIDKIKGSEFQGFFFSTIPAFKQGVTFYRYKPWNSWTKPVKISSPSELESWDNQCFYWQYSDGKYGVAIPISQYGYRTTLGSEHGSWGSKALSYVDDYKTDLIPAMVIGFGDNLYSLMKDVYESSMEFMNTPENLARKKEFPEPMEYIGWCTWNASEQGSKLNEETVIRGVESFTENKFPLGWVLFDDGWFNNKNSQLRSLHPDTTKFPNGFSPLVKRLKNEFHLKHVGIWHAFNGYWNGIDPTSKLGEHYKNELFSWTQKTRVEDDNSPVATYHFIKPSSDSLRAFYNSLHTYLKKEGITFVKVDNQLSVERMSPGNFPIGELAKSMHAELNASVKKYFNNAIINCMDMTADAYYNFGSTPIARSVEDYFPYEEGENYNLQRGNAAAHILQGIYNNVYFSQMVFPDLDMFQSHNPNGEYHAIARAINNGPIYVTDNAGEQNFEILNKLILQDGRILRADLPLLPTHDCLFQVQDTKPFKAFSKSNGIGLVGVWNAADANEVNGYISPSDLDNFIGKKFAVYESFSGKMVICDYQTNLPVSLKRMGYQLYLIASLKNGMAPFGLLNKYNSPSTLVSYTIKPNQLRVTLKEYGTFGAVLPSKPKFISVNGEEQKDFSFENGLLKLSVKDEKKEVFNILITL